MYHIRSVASVILHTLYMYHIRSVASLATPYFTALSHKQYDLQRKCIGHKIYFVLNISHSKKNWLRYYHTCTYIGLHVKYPLFLSNFNETWIFLKDLKKILNYQILWKSVQWEPSCSTRAEEWMDEQTDRQTWRSWYSLLTIWQMPKNKGCVADDLDNKYYRENSYNSSCHTDYSIHEHEAY